MTRVSGSGARTLAILDLFTEARPEWLPEEMMEALGYTRPTLYRYLKTLREAGFLVSLPQGGLALGPRVTELDFLMQRADPLILAGTPALHDLARRFPGSAFIVRWYGGKLLCVASVVSAPRPVSAYPRGRPMPIGRGAASRAIAAHLPARERRRLAEDHVRAFAASGVGGTLDDVLAELRRVRREGVASARGEVTPGVVGVAAPVLAGGSAPLGAICLSSDEREVDEVRLDEIRGAVRDAGRAVSARLASETAEIAAETAAETAAEDARPRRASG